MNKSLNICSMVAEISESRNNSDDSFPDKNPSIKRQTFLFASSTTPRRSALRCNGYQFGELGFQTRLHLLSCIVFCMFFFLFQIYVTNKPSSLWTLVLPFYNQPSNLTSRSSPNPHPTGLGGGVTNGAINQIIHNESVCVCGQAAPIHTHTYVRTQRMKQQKSLLEKQHLPVLSSNNVE